MQENFRQLCQLAEKARKAYTEMVNGLEQEMTPISVSSVPDKETVLSSVPGIQRGPMTGNLGGFEKLFPHLGHSRTPSACSAISIISSVLSEPASENYPASDPDVESARSGHETKDTGSSQVRKVTDLDTVGESREEGPDVGVDAVEKQNVDDFDDGHEADTEDDSESVTSPVRRQTLTSRAGSERVKSECSSEHGRSAVATGKLAVVEPTPAETSAVIADHPSTATTAMRSPTIDNTRIETWVAESQRAIEHMRANSSSSGNHLDVEDDEDVDIEDIEVVVDSLNRGVESLLVVGDAVDNDDEDDAASMKTVDEGSSSASSDSNYVEACGDGAV